MKNFSFSDLNRRPGEVLDAALAEPVTLTRHGKPKLVVMNADLFERISFTRSYTIGGAPEEVHAELMDVVDEILHAE